MPIEMILAPSDKDLGGGFAVRRLLPSGRKQSVGPFLFFDHFGPVMHQPGKNMDVRAHPHIGLATVTYLFEGAITHRDSLGCVQRIEPGAINWMTAGSGIVHSERTPDELRNQAHSVHGLQLWAGLPLQFEETEPSFAHTPAADLPRWEAPLVSGRVLIGSAFGLSSPVRTFAPTLYLDIELKPGGAITLDAPAPELAIYGVDSPLEVDGQRLEPFHLALLQPGKATHVAAAEGARFVALGGEPLDGQRFIWWNFVASSRERIEAAKEDWRLQRFASVPGETEFIPLP